jgi:tetratricopeptide (TPR) repeat protein
MAFFDRLLRRSPPSFEAIARAEALIEQGDYQRAWELAKEAAGRACFATGPLAARLHADLGECAFQLGEPVRALATTRKALRLARDTHLRVAIFGNLYEVYRYLGDNTAAAEVAAQLALVSGGEEARRYSRQAALVRRGEPLVRVVAEVDGRRHEIEEVLEGIPGPVRLVYARNRLTLRLAEKWTREGEQLAQAGDFAEAMERYDAAMRLDPHTPEPAYQAGFVRGHEGRWDEARGYFETAERLAPGWFLGRSALALLRLDLPDESFRLWHALAEGPLPHEAKRQLAEQALASTPPVGRTYFHHLHGKALQGLKRPEAERAFRIGLEHAAEPDLTTRLCVDLAAVVPSPQEKSRLLNRAVAINGDPVAVATARIVLAFE